MTLRILPLPQLIVNFLRARSQPESTVVAGLRLHRP